MTSSREHCTVWKTLNLPFSFGKGKEKIKPCRRHGYHQMSVGVSVATHKAPGRVVYQILIFKTVPAAGKQL